MTDITTTDEELEALMAELEAQNEQIAAQAKAAEPPAPAIEPEPEPEPEPAPWVETEEASPAPAPEVSDDEALAALEAELEAQEAQKVTSAPTTVTLKVNATQAVEQVSAALEAVKETTSGGVVGEVGVELSLPPALPKMAPEDAPDVGVEHVPGMVPGLQFYVDVNAFRNETRVTETNLDDAMFQQAGLRAYYGANAANAEAQAARLKMKFDIIEATLYDKHRKALAASGEKTTEKMVENAVKMDPRWMKAKSLVIEAETIATIGKNLVESLKDRRDMIIQLGADRRDEYKGAARVLAEKNENLSLAERAAAAARAATQSRAA